MKKTMLAISAAALLFIGCGGGSSSSSDNTLEPLSLNQDSATKIVEAIKESSNQADSSTDNASTASSSLNSVSSDSNFVSKNRHLALNFLKNIASKPLNATISEELNCTNGGKVIITGTIDDNTSEGVLTEEFQNCSEDGFTEDGIVKLTFTNYDPNTYFYKNIKEEYLTDFKVCDSNNICDTTLQGAYNALEIYRIHNENNITYIDSFKFNTTSKHTTFGQTLGEEDSEYYFDTNNTLNTIKFYPTKGKLLFDNYYVEYDSDHANDMSNNPIEVNLTNNQFLRGELYLKAGTSKMKIIFGSTPTAYIDKDGDGTYEEEVPLNI
jgi:hypothetical protein